MDKFNVDGEGNNKLPHPLLDKQHNLHNLANNPRLLACYAILLFTEK